tara:strand:+ start:1427 stop:2086 length:660 start_codon:yes stop_codon:yes gene_type:complete
LTSREFARKLEERAGQAGLLVSAELSSHLETYYRLLKTWNQKINLTAFNLSELSAHSFDRLLIEPLVAARHTNSDLKSMLDIGSGNGSPAIPLKLAIPHLSLLMVESKTRKAVFLKEAIRALALLNAEVVTNRYEELLKHEKFQEAWDLITIRAIRLEEKSLIDVQRFLRPGGLLFLFLNSRSAKLLEETALPLIWKSTHPLAQALHSHLAVFQKPRPK